MNQPNVVLLTIDTLRQDMLGCYDPGAPPTPHLDRLAARGVRFEQAITGGSWTQAAFPVMLTSTYASMYGGCLGRLADERPSPVESLAALGYTTAGFSTNPHLSRATGYDRGFGHFHDLSPLERDPRLRRLKGGQRLLRTSLFHQLMRFFGGQMRPARIYSSAAEVTDVAGHWLEGTRTPYFAWLHYMDLHWPYHLEETLTHPRDIAEAWQDVAIMNGRSNFERDRPLTEAESNHFRELYRQSMRYLDSQIGRLLDYLESTDKGANTIVVVVSDHGEEFMDHGRWGHWESNLFDEILKVPLIIRPPGMDEGRVIQRQVRLLDLMPTILDLCGGPAPEGMLGTSMVPLWQGNEADYDVDVAISEMQRGSWHRVALRTEKFKYIWDSKRPQEPALYDLKADPGETQNVSERYAQEAHRFQNWVDVHLVRVARSQPDRAVQQLEFDEEVARRLKALGYVD